MYHSDYTYFLLLSCIFFVIWPLRIYAQISFNKEKTINHSKNDHKCRYNNSFVWCVPFDYNKVDEPWRHVCTTHSMLPWIYGFKFVILEVQEVNDDKQTITLSMYMKVKWFEPRLQINESSHEWNETSFGPPDEVNTSPELIHEFWQPDIEIYRLQKYAQKRVNTDMSGLKIRKNKEIVYETRVDVTISCLMNFDDYPLDSHNCPFEAGSYNYVEDTVNCYSIYTYAAKDQRTLQHLIKIEDLSQMNKTYGEEKENITKEFAKCGFNIVLKRTRFQIVFQVYLTSALFVIVSWVSFVIKPEVVPGRMGLLITIFLVLINIFNGVKSDAPVSSRLNAVDQYVLGCIGFVFLALMQYTLVLCGNRNEKQPPSTSKLLNVTRKIMAAHTEVEEETQTSKWSTQIQEMKKGCVKSGADSFSLFLFPLALLCFNACYWIN